MNLAELAAQWREATHDMVFSFPHAESVGLDVHEGVREIIVQFTMFKLVDARGGILDTLDFKFFAADFPGRDTARAWTKAAWNLLKEHEALEMSGLDPHNSFKTVCVEHRKALHMRHDMQFMLANYGDLKFRP